MAHLWGFCRLDGFLFLRLAGLSGSPTLVNGVAVESVYDDGVENVADISVTDVRNIIKYNMARMMTT